MPLLILIAEDDPGIRLAVNDYLEMSGYSVITVTFFTVGCSNAANMAWRPTSDKPPIPYNTTNETPLAVPAADSGVMITIQ